MKTCELTEAALDWAVGHALGRALGRDYDIVDGVPVTGKTICTIEGLGFDEIWSPSTNWEQGGPIMEREDIAFRKYHHPGTPAHGTYYAKVCRESGQLVAWYKTRDSWGPTPLIAAMRCFVASKLGDEVEIPEELS